MLLGLGAGAGFGVVEVAVRLIGSLTVPRIFGDPALYAVLLGGAAGFLLLTSTFQSGSVTVATAGMVLVETAEPAVVGILWLGDRPRNGLDIGDLHRDEHRHHEEHRPRDRPRRR